MDTIKNIFVSIKNYFMNLKTEQKMKWGAAILGIIGGGVLALAASQDDEMIDITDSAMVLDGDQEVEIPFTEEDTDISE